MRREPSSMAGGIFVAIGVIAGVVIGNHYGQASAGFLGGLAAGILAAVALWLVDRNRVGD
jgi:formate/nitrite transporter FocA (FNT family)